MGGPFAITDPSIRCGGDGGVGQGPPSDLAVPDRFFFALGRAVNHLDSFTAAF
jgi:hypothetical protein